ncbi:MAG: hypothetical protein KDI33_08480 [Halioglobus sp.]|nr:hypothetical protein [Halioglobus sp.]
MANLADEAAAPTMVTRPVRVWPVLGLRGQFVGTVEHCAVDVTRGAIHYVELKTPWQNIAVKWAELEFNKELQAFQLVKPVR